MVLVRTKNILAKSIFMDIRKEIGIKFEIPSKEHAHIIHQAFPLLKRGDISKGYAIATANELTFVGIDEYLESHCEIYEWSYPVPPNEYLLQVLELQRYTALIHPLRQRILGMVKKEKCMNQKLIMERMEMSQAFICIQLGFMVDAGIINMERKGRQNLYTIPTH